MCSLGNLPLVCPLLEKVVYGWRSVIEELLNISGPPFQTDKAEHVQAKIGIVFYQDNIPVMVVYEGLWPSQNKLLGKIFSVDD